MRERSERVESPGIYVTESVSLSFMLGTVLWWLSHGEGKDTVTGCGWDKL